MSPFPISLYPIMVLEEGREVLEEELLQVAAAAVAWEEPEGKTQDFLPI